MSSDKMTEAKDTVVDTADKTKKAGEEKVDDVKKSTEPTYTDQAKEKAEQAKKAAADTQTSVTDNLAAGWNKTKETVSGLNQYPDKK